MAVQTIVVKGERFVVVPESEWLCRGTVGPELPPRDVKGNYPAAAAMRVTIARSLSRRRRAAGISQVELGRRAGVRTETVNRLEQGKHTPTIATLEKLQRALDAAERELND